MFLILSPDGKSEDRVGVSVAVAVVGVATTVAGGPDEDAALAVAASDDAVQESAFRQRSGTVN